MNIDEVIADAKAEEETILNLIKQEKTKRRNVDINIMGELIKNFIIEDGMIADLKIK